jgi:crotonobetainyl-CoA:carnitine CoA-transferase CaiB-like acyl-CoA transferase
MEDELPLEGARVLELWPGYAAAFAGRFLAGYGADVVRAGEAGTLSDDERTWLLSHGQSVGVSTPEELRPLVEAAEIVLVDWSGKQRPSMAAEIEAALDQRRDVLVVSVTPFGRTGQYADYEATNLTSFASGGIMSLTGHPSREPLVTGGSQALAIGALNAFSAAVTGYYGMLVSGEGDWIDISLQECAASMLELYGPGSAAEGTGPAPRRGNHLRAVWGIYPCADGWAGVCCLERQVPAFFRLLDDPVLAEPRFLDPVARAEHDDELTAMVYGWFADKTKSDILELGPAHRVPFGAVMTPLDLLENESLAERRFFDTMETGEGHARLPGRPFPGFGWRAGQPGTSATVGEVISRWNSGARGAQE